MENQNQNPRSQLIERLKESNNVLVTVSRNPSVDQLSSAIGLTLMLNHLGKHATAVFSGEVPNTLEFLKPEETLEKNTDSLRDFIISLDKAKADKLRYKVEDKMVKIFITPYRTSLSESDLIFGQGDFNVDVVVAIGVQEKEDLDEAITSHGRILHDATVATLNTATNGQLGSINWVDTKASSLCEMLVSVCEALKANSLDAQMATAFLTGIVAETQRFSNEKTSSDTMNTSAKLMAAGANQQLVATKLEQPAAPPSQSDREETQADTPKDQASNNDGSLDIDHAAEETPADSPPQSDDTTTDLPEIQPEHQEEPEPAQAEEVPADGGEKDSRLILEPPTLGGTLTANSKVEGLDPSTDPLTVQPVDSPLLTHDDKDQEPQDILAPLDAPEQKAEETKQPPAPTPEPVVPAQPPELPAPVPMPAEEPPAQLLEPPAATAAEPAPEPEKPADNQTLSDLEAAVDSPHVADGQQSQAKPDADAALAAAHDALNAADDTPEKPAAFNSAGLMDVSHDEADATEAPPAEPAAEQPVNVSIDPSTGTLSYPSNLVPPSPGLPADPTAASVQDPTAPPTVPPPMSFPPMMPPSDDPNNLPPVNP